VAHHEKASSESGLHAKFVRIWWAYQGMRIGIKLPQRVRGVLGGDARGISSSRQQAVVPNIW